MSCSMPIPPENNAWEWTQQVLEQSYRIKCLGCLGTLYEHLSGHDVQALFQAMPHHVSNVERIVPAKRYDVAMMR